MVCVFCLSEMARWCSNFCRFVIWNTNVTFDFSYKIRYLISSFSFSFSTSSKSTYQQIKYSYWYKCTHRIHRHTIHVWCLHARITICWSEWWPDRYVRAVCFHVGRMKVFRISFYGYSVPVAYMRFAIPKCTYLYTDWYTAIGCSMLMRTHIEHLLIFFLVEKKNRMNVCVYKHVYARTKLCSGESKWHTVISYSICYNSEALPCLRMPTIFDCFLGIWILCVTKLWHICSNQTALPILYCVRNKHEMTKCGNCCRFRFLI